MQKLDQIYEGRAKKVFKTDDPYKYIVEYKDTVLFKGESRLTSISDRGVISNRVSNLLMKLLEENGVPTHFIEQLSDRETLVKKVSMIPLDVVVRNIAAGSVVERLGVKEGKVFLSPLLDYSYKNDRLGDPLINEHHMAAIGLCTKDELAEIEMIALKINVILRDYMEKHGITLVDFKLEFGRTHDGEIILADEISPDTCRLWDSKTGEKLDKERFRRDLVGAEEVYRQILTRLLG